VLNDPKELFPVVAIACVRFLVEEVRPDRVPLVVFAGDHVRFPLFDALDVSLKRSDDILWRTAPRIEPGDVRTSRNCGEGLPFDVDATEGEFLVERIRDTKSPLAPYETRGATDPGMDFPPRLLRKELENLLNRPTVGGGVTKIQVDFDEECYSCCVRTQRLGKP
jgi:hypothetical protein